ncbi:MAG: thioredoxin family protein [Bacteroidota bacterium]
MKTSLWFIVIALFISFAAQAQEKNIKITDEKYEEEILLGYCDREGLQYGEFGESYDQEYSEYDARRKAVRKIKRTKQDYEIVLVLATWCHDSKEQVPRFFRVLDESGIPEDIMTVICVDGEKAGGEVSVESYNIERVPTFIFFRNGEEIGRIIETPEMSLEEDMLEIVY